MHLHGAFNSVEALGDFSASPGAVLLQGAKDSDANAVSECFNGSLH